MPLVSLELVLEKHAPQKTKSKKKNLLFQELCNNYELIFTYGINAFNEAINENASMVDAITHTYITLLSLNLDSIVFRKHGRDKAFKVMQQAKNIMENSPV